MGGEVPGPTNPSNADRPTKNQALGQAPSSGSQRLSLTMRNPCMPQSQLGTPSAPLLGVCLVFFPYDVPFFIFSLFFLVWCGGFPCFFSLFFSLFFWWFSLFFFPCFFGFSLFFFLVFLWACQAGQSAKKQGFLT